MRKLALSAVLTAAFTLGSAFAQTTLLNVSYDPTRELYKDFNTAFNQHWQAKTGQTVNIRQSHGGSTRSSRRRWRSRSRHAVRLGVPSTCARADSHARSLPACA